MTGIHISRHEYRTGARGSCHGRYLYGYTSFVVHIEQASVEAIEKINAIDENGPDDIEVGYMIHDLGLPVNPGPDTQQRALTPSACR